VPFPEGFTFFTNIMIAVIKPTAIKKHTTTNAIATTFRNVLSMWSVSIRFTSVNDWTGDGRRTIGKSSLWSSVSCLTKGFERGRVIAALSREGGEPSCVFFISLPLTVAVRPQGSEKKKT